MNFGCNSAIKKLDNKIKCVNFLWRLIPLILMLRDILYMKLEIQRIFQSRIKDRYNICDGPFLCYLYLPNSTIIIVRRGHKYASVFENKSSNMVNFSAFLRFLWKVYILTITYKIFETNYGFHVKECTTGKVQFLFFRKFLLVLTKFSFREGN